MGNKIIRISVHFMPGGDIVGMCEQILGTNVDENNWIEVKKKKNYFVIVNSSMLDMAKEIEQWDGVYSLGLAEWDETVKPWVEFEDGLEEFGIATHARWQDVKFNLREDIIEAPTAEKLEEALKHVKFCVWNTWDI